MADTLETMILLGNTQFSGRKKIVGGHDAAVGPSGIR
jgi:hypothetical protein